MTDKGSHSSDWPNFTQEEAEAVSRVLLSNKVNYWTGSEGREFEKEFASFAATSHAIAVANGTVALDLIFHGLGVGSRNGGAASDEVVVTPRSFMASVSSVINAGAIPIFADVGLESQNIEPSTVSQCLTENTRAILCVHLAGWPCDMDGFHELSKGRRIALVEDCAQAHGALYKGKPVGGLGDAAAWSFCQDKIMTTGGEGGMVTCNDDALWRRMWAYKDHGKSYEAVYEREHPPGFRWLHESIGTNWRLTEMQSAIGRIQLRRMQQWNSQRTENAAKLDAILAPYAGEKGILRIPQPGFQGYNNPHIKNATSRNAWYKYYAFVRPENIPCGKTREDLILEFNRQGFVCMQGSCPEIYIEKSIQELNLAPEKKLDIAELLGRTSLMFQVHPGMEYPSLDLSSWMA